ncbi:hypothetical protein RQP46_007273 [Phenoliferia psychrophenolica]
MLGGSTLLFLLAASASVSALPAKRAANAAPLEPSQDPFYQPPDGFLQTPPGTVLRSRSIQASVVSIIPVPLTSYQVLYTTTDALGNPMATVTTIIIPPGANPENLVAYATPEDSTSSIFQLGASLAHFELSFVGDLSSMAVLLLQGIMVTMPDHEGPTSTFAAGRKSGMAVLDAIRATLNFGKTIGLHPTAKSGMWGYSGGAQAVAWAAALKDTYAPELNVVGAAYGGTPADMKKVVKNLNNGFGSGLALSGLVGLMHAYPDFSAQITKLLTPEGQALVDDNTQHCLVDLRATFVNVLDPKYIIGGDSALNLPAIASVLEENRLGANSTLTPTFPLHVVHGSIDELIPYEVEKIVVDEYCKNGANLEFVTGPLLGHIGMDIASILSASNFLADRLAGKPFAPGCVYRDGI